MFIEEGKKLFTVTLKENAYGRFLRITEEKPGGINSIVVPAEAMEDFLTVILEMMKVHKETSPAGHDTPPSA
jgi:PurA ssDNA and RNA-binding protein